MKGPGTDTGGPDVVPDLECDAIPRLRDSEQIDQVFHRHVREDLGKKFVGLENLGHR